jgi:cytochrome c biogenesis protein ResB
MLRIVCCAVVAMVLSLSALATQSKSAVPAKSVAHHTRVARRHHHHRKAKAVPPTRVEVYNGSKTQTQVFTNEPAKLTRKSARPTPAITRVDVINGSDKQMQVFRAEPELGAQSAKTSRKSHSQRNIAQTNIADVEILNGTTKQRRIFKDDGVVNSSVPAQPGATPVVVGIASTGAASAQRGAPPVVTGMESGTHSATTGPAVGVAPSPGKRPPYTPAPKD